MTTTNLDELAGKLERAGWPSVAEDVRDGIPLQVIANRLVNIGEGDSEAYELVMLADEGA